ncbi:MAG: hypothetical protein A2889_00670 [Nitrospinae bacterium RIFCSPLOWO2_01_FULL_39_10]|nr:MAG: hypothetical protein A2889_00670 [Nitrospinae bacterium RIFCSPLOWO2_01_FULL_39_10]
MVKKTYKGIIEGNVIRLQESVDLPEGTEALISISLFKKEKEREIMERELSFLEKGFDMGKILYVKREELYDIKESERQIIAVK